MKFFRPEFSGKKRPSPHFIGKAKNGDSRPGGSLDGGWIACGIDLLKERGLHPFFVLLQAL